MIVSTNDKSDKNNNNDNDDDTMIASTTRNEMIRMTMRMMSKLRNVLRRYEVLSRGAGRVRAERVERLTLTITWREGVIAIRREPAIGKAIACGEVVDLIGRVRIKV